MMRSVIVLVLLTLGGAWSLDADAHATSTSYLEARPAREGQDLVLRWDVAAIDLATVLDVDRNADGSLTWGEVAQSEEAIRKTLEAGIAVARGGKACDVRATDVAIAMRTDEPFVSIALSAACASGGSVQIEPYLLWSRDPSQRLLLRADLGGSTFNAALAPGASVWQQPAAASALSAFTHFVGQGFWHVLIGYDHIVFVLLLLLPAVLTARREGWAGTADVRAVIADIVRIVTAFTIAHSITLGLAATGTLVPPAKPIEIGIAATIVATGLANLFPALHRSRLPLAFLFGLVHGFGFANALGELEEGGTGLVPLLGGFNVGVELAQLALVALALPLLLTVRSTDWYSRRAMPSVSCILAGIGVWWLIARLA
jgi:hypothetical protein